MILSVLAALAGTLSVAQGQAVRVDWPSEPDTTAIEMVWNERRVPFVLTDDGWFTVVGVDLDVPSGDHVATVIATRKDGGSQSHSLTIAVAEQAFPTTRLTVEPKYVELSPENQARAASERVDIDAIYSRLTPEPYWSAPFIVPIAGIDGGRNFGHRRYFNDQPRAPHSGADLSATTGTPVGAANRGRVVLARDLFYSGNAVFVDHGLGVVSVYLHLSEISVELGEMVERGQTVGLVGATGRVTGPHLHWGVRILDARVDPFSLLELGGSGGPGH